MSIWVSREPIGAVPESAAQATRGTVISYATGWSSHYPSTDGTVEQPAQVHLAHIPSWCVPGHKDSDAEDISGPWARLWIETTSHDREGRPTEHRLSAAVCLDEAAARTLAHELLAWADEKHVATNPAV